MVSKYGKWMGLMMMISVASGWAQTQSPPLAPIKTVDTVIVVVNSDVITARELDERLRLIETRMNAQGMSLPPKEELRKQLLERLIVERAQLQLAKESGIRVDDNVLDRAVARIAEQNKLSVVDFRNHLEKEGMVFPRFREEIRNEIALQRLREREVDNKIQISESEIEQFLIAQSGAAAGQMEFNLAQILIRIPENASAEQITTQRNKAEAVLRQLRSGAEFSKLSAIYSDATDALNGGDLGWRNADRVPQLFLDAVATLQSGQTSEIIKSANGFHIIKLLGKRSPSLVKANNSGVQQTHARHILIRVSQIVSAGDARRKLEDLKERLDHGGDFQELARLFSNDGSASKGGDLGWVYPGDTVPEFERAMDALRSGQISDPIETPFGYHLIQVVERKVDDVSEERQRLSARMALRERKLEEATQDWLRQVRDQAYVEYRTDDNK